MASSRPDDALPNTTVARGEGKFEAMRQPKREARPWPEDFKVAPMTTGAKLKSHPDYVAAKSGDRDAALRVVTDLAKPEKLREMAARHPDAIVVAVHAEEASGFNQIPRKFADYIGYVTGLEVDPSIVQSNRAGRTGQGDWYRMGNRPEFDGEVQPGRKYIIVDDVVA
ncbi:MAG: phosphoribosyltransferase, partial [Fimbriimonadaceae bacterium]|nr:phosphoribosyltransferase [Fimbriimonadaceae bacterium]